MNFRLTAALFGTVFVVGLALLGLALWGDDDAPPTGLVLADLAGAKADDIAAVEMTRGGSRLVLKRVGPDKWAIAEPITARADPFAVEAAVNALLAARATRHGELSSNPAVHGLADPGLTVTLTDATGKTGTVHIGDVTTGGDKAVAFVNTPGRARPVAVPRSAVEPLLRTADRKSGPAGDLAKWTADYRARQVFAVDPRAGTDDIAAVKLTLPNQGKELALAKSAGGWAFTSPAGWGDADPVGDPAAPGAITGATQLLTLVAGLKALAPDDFIETPGDLKEYGLNPDDPDLLRVEITPTDGPPGVAFLGNSVDPNADKPKVPGTPPAPGKVYVRVEGTPGVIRATLGTSKADLVKITADPDPLRDRDLVKDAARARIDAIDVTTGGQTIKLRKLPGAPGWKLYGGPAGPQDANPAAVQDLLDLLTKRDIVKEFPAPADANFAEKQAEVKLWADAVEPPADPKVEPTLRPAVSPTALAFGKQDATGVFVRRTLPNGTAADFVLPPMVQVGAATVGVGPVVTRTRLDYLDPTLDGFATTRADRLRIDHDGKTTEVTLEKDSASASFPGGKWVFTQPDAMAGVIADAGFVRGDLLNFLASQPAVRYVAENATDDQLKAWQLDAGSSRMTVAVGLGAAPPGTPPPDKPGERVYRFGTDTADGQHVHARIDDGRLVFTVPKSLFDKFATADLRDKTLVRFDPAAVKVVKLRGWTEVIGQMQVRQFERTAGGWKAVDPAGYNVDPAKVEQFLKDLLALRVKEFRSGPETPDYRFAPEQSGFEVTLDQDGADDLVLIVGAEVDNKASRAAKLMILSTPQRVIIGTVPPDALKAYRDSPGAFLK